MPVIVVANPKGGVGKSTLSTQIAGYFASQNHRVMLGDADRQQSSKLWLSLRPDHARPIRNWELGNDQIAKPPRGTTHVVLDPPAGLHGKRLREILKRAHKVVVPLQPSVFDIFATQDFLNELADNARAAKIEIGIVGMRVDERTRAAEQLHTFWKPPACRCWVMCATRKTTSSWRPVASPCLTWRPSGWRGTWPSGKPFAAGWINSRPDTLRGP